MTAQPPLKSAQLFRSEVLLRAAVFFLLTASAVCFPIGLGRFLWPDGLVAWANHIFWPATGVNVAALLVLGWRYWPVILLNTFPAWLLIGQPLDLCILGSFTNALEALLAYWLVVRVGGYVGEFDRIRPVAALLFASMIAPLVNTLLFPAYLVAKGAMPGADYWKAIGNFNLANGAAMLLLAPFLIALARRRWNFPKHQWWETATWLAVAALGGIAAFSAVFSGLGMNFAFLVFPAVIYAAVRFGPQELAASLFAVLASIYIALALQAHHVPSDEMPTIIWFTQAFCWVLASTGLIIAALVGERLQAEVLANTETRRALEASLREERARLDALRYQINPHFLFNSLNAIRASIPAESTQSDNMIADLAGYLRTTLDQSDEDTATLKDEIRSVRQYLAIEHRRFGDDLDVSFSIDPATEEAIVPVFLLQPLVENAIRHGFESSKGTFRLIIHSSQDEARLRIEVSNTGTWKSPVDDGRKHLGLENIRRRLTLLHGKSARLDISATDDLVSVYIEIPKGEPCAA